MTTFGIIASWMILMVSIALFAFTVEMLWRGFALLFGVVDNYLQNRHWKNKGYTLMTDDKGQDFWVGYGE